MAGKIGENMAAEMFDLGRQELIAAIQGQAVEAPQAEAPQAPASFEEALDQSARSAPEVSLDQGIER
jgi:hypothetical protein